MDSPNPSFDSADAALYEMLGIDELNLEVADEAVDCWTQQHGPSRVTASCRPPAACQRAQTPHDPLLLQTTRPLLTLHQCNHIISLGCRASNDGGIHHGPSYITAAQNPQSGVAVTLQTPNHHKVCVFKDALVLKWLRQVFEGHFDEYIQQWCHDNNSNNNSNVSSTFKINPRLRLLRYDARDEDVFLPHYDATTTCEDDDGTEWESRLTILLYLNSGGGAHFSGGKTFFLNALQPSDYLAVKPQRGHLVVFNHELYHASQELVYEEHLVVEDVIGGSKFVLRSDVMFAKECDVPVVTVKRGLEIMEAPPPDVMVEAILEALSNVNHLADVLDELDMRSISVKSLLVPGRKNVSSMLLDLGVDKDQCETFIAECERSVR
jgi:hypothetical protein